MTQSFPVCTWSFAFSSFLREPISFNLNICAEYGDTANVNPDELQQPEQEFDYGQVFGQAQEVDGDQNALRLFFDTLLPWNLIPRDQQGEYDE